MQNSNEVESKPKAKRGMPKIKKLFKSLDIYGKPVTMTYNEEE